MIHCDSCGNDFTDTSKRGEPFVSRHEYCYEHFFAPEVDDSWRREMFGEIIYALEMYRGMVKQRIEKEKN